jgi:integrase
MLSFYISKKKEKYDQFTSPSASLFNPVLKALGLPQARMHAFRHGCNRRWELSGMNPAVLRQQMGHSSAAMTARYTGEIPHELVRAAFSDMLMENMENSRSVRAVA